jgi:hypothetical protein
LGYFGHDVISFAYINKFDLLILELIVVSMFIKDIALRIFLEIPRQRIEGGSRKHASYSEILERCWRHTLQAKPTRRGKTLTPSHLQPVQSISTSL